MAADSNMGFQQGLVPLFGYDHPVHFRSGAAVGGSLYPVRSDRSVGGSPGGALVGNSGNLLLDAAPAGGKQEAGLAADWTYQEQALLEEGLVRFADQPNIMKYIKVAALLPDKTVRDVALRSQWMVKKNGKRRKLEEYYMGAKNNVRKDKAVNRIAPSSMPSEYPVNMSPYSFQRPQTNNNYFPHKGPTIDGASSHLLNENTTLLCQIEANLESLKLDDNIRLLNHARNNIKTILDSLGQMPPLPGIVSQMPPLPVFLHEELAEGLFLSSRLSQQQSPYGILGIHQLKQERRC